LIIIEIGLNDGREHSWDHSTVGALPATGGTDTQDEIHDV